MRNLFTCFFLLLAFTVVQAQQKFDDFSKDFVKRYQDLHMPDLELSYVSGLQRIGATVEEDQEVCIACTVSYNTTLNNQPAISVPVQLIWIYVHSRRCTGSAQE